LFLDKRRISAFVKITALVMAVAFIATLAVPLIGTQFLGNGTPTQTSTVDQGQQEIQTLEGLTKTKPTDYRIWLSLGNKYIEFGMTDKAIGAYEKAKELQPQQSEVLYRLGTAYSQAGRRAEAVTAFEGFLALAPSSPLAPQVKARVESLKKAPAPPAATTTTTAKP